MDRRTDRRYNPHRSQQAMTIQDRVAAEVARMEGLIAEIADCLGLDLDNATDGG